MQISPSRSSCSFAPMALHGFTRLTHGLRPFGRASWKLHFFAALRLIYVLSAGLTFPLVQAQQIHFPDVTAQAGLRFVHNNGAFGRSGSRKQWGRAALSSTMTTMAIQTFF